MRICCLVLIAALLTSTAWAGSSGQDIQAPSIVTAGVPFAISITPNCPQTEAPPRDICVSYFHGYIDSSDPLATIPSGTFTTNPNQTTSISQPMVMRTVGQQFIGVRNAEGGLPVTFRYVTVTALEQLPTLGTTAGLFLAASLAWYGARRVIRQS